MDVELYWDKLSSLSWEDSGCSLNTFLTSHRQTLPHVVRVVEGFCAESSAGTIDSEQILVLHEIHKETKILTKDNQQRDLLIPNNFQVKVEVVPMNSTEEYYCVRDLLRSFPTYFRVLDDITIPARIHAGSLFRIARQKGHHNYLDCVYLEEGVDKCGVKLPLDLEGRFQPLQDGREFFLDEVFTGKDDLPVAVRFVKSSTLLNPSSGATMPALYELGNITLLGECETETIFATVLDQQEKSLAVFPWNLSVTVLPVKNLEDSEYCRLCQELKDLEMMNVKRMKRVNKMGVYYADCPIRQFSEIVLVPPMRPCFRRMADKIPREHDSSIVTQRENENPQVTQRQQEKPQVTSQEHHVQPLPGFRGSIIKQARPIPKPRSATNANKVPTRCPSESEPIKPFETNIPPPLPPKGPLSGTAEKETGKLRRGSSVDADTPPPLPQRVPVPPPRRKRCQSAPPSSTCGELDGYERMDGLFLDLPRRSRTRGVTETEKLDSEYERMDRLSLNGVRKGKEQTRRFCKEDRSAVEDTGKTREENVDVNGNVETEDKKHFDGVEDGMESGMESGVESRMLPRETENLPKDSQNVRKETTHASIGNGGILETKQHSAKETPTDGEALAIPKETKKLPRTTDITRKAVNKSGEFIQENSRASKIIHPVFETGGGSQAHPPPLPPKLRDQQYTCHANISTESCCLSHGEILACVTKGGVTMDTKKTEPVNDDIHARKNPPPLPPRPHVKSTEHKSDEPPPLPTTPRPSLRKHSGVTENVTTAVQPDLRKQAGYADQFTTTRPTLNKHSRVTEDIPTTIKTLSGEAEYLTKTSRKHSRAGEEMVTAQNISNENWRGAEGVSKNSKHSDDFEYIDDLQLHLAILESLRENAQDLSKEKPSSGDYEEIKDEETGYHGNAEDRLPRQPRETRRSIKDRKPLPLPQELTSKHDYEDIGKMLKEAAQSDDWEYFDDIVLHLKNKAIRPLSLLTESEKREILAERRTILEDARTDEERLMYREPLALPEESKLIQETTKHDFREKEGKSKEVPESEEWEYFDDIMLFLKEKRIRPLSSLTECEKLERFQERKKILEEARTEEELFLSQECDESNSDSSMLDQLQEPKLLPPSPPPADYLADNETPGGIEPQPRPPSEYLSPDDERKTRRSYTWSTSAEFEDVDDIDFYFEKRGLHSSYSTKF